MAQKSCGFHLRKNTIQIYINHNSHDCDVHAFTVRPASITCSNSKTVLTLTFHIDICAFSIMPTEVACLTDVFSTSLPGNIRDSPSFTIFFYTAVYVCPSDSWRGPRNNRLKSQISVFYDRMTTHV